ncbi:uncharacterized protein [Miscanthus floridulus]|uniref:uncharacterized protein n=1 Tax=Miscanthus floridulus TaxID=154761 RepID=UPI0034599BA1
MANHHQRISPSPRNPPLLASCLPATPSVQGLDVHQSGGSQEIHQEPGTSRNRAKWDHQKRLHLIKLLKIYDVPRFRTHSAWSKEAWTGIVAQFDKKFSLSFSIAQVKQKEQDMKKEYRTIKDLVAESGFGWDSDRMMVTAPPDVWAAMEARKNKDALFWQDKSFPYYDDLFALYDGHYAEERSCRGMDHYANKAILPSQVSPDVHLQSPSPSIPAPGSFSFDAEEDRDDTNWFGNDAFTPLGTFMPQETPDGPSSINIAPHVPEQFEETLCHSARPSSSTPEAVDGTRNKKQKTKYTITTEDFHEKYLKLKKEEIERFAAIEEKKLDDPFSINKCITLLEGLSELQTSDMLKAADIFKDNPSNREVFLSFGSDALRVGWLLRQI